MRKSIQSWRSGIARMCGGLILTAGLWVLTAGAANYYVRPPGTTTTVASPYDTWEKAATNIQLAVDVAMANLPATVLVTNGAYCVTNQIVITNSITVTSVSGWPSTLVYADWPSIYTTRIFYVVNAGTVDGFTISNGHIIAASGPGGGGAYVASNALIRNCYFITNYCNNTAAGNEAGGGGLYIEKAVGSNCLFIKNIDPFTGFSGAYVGNGGVLYNCSAERNIYVGIRNFQGLVINCTSAWNNTYGIQCNKGTNIGCTIISNSNNGVEELSGSYSNCLMAFNGIKGFSSGGGSPNVVNCVMSNNSGFGGSFASLIMRSCTIVDNKGGGLQAAPTIIENCRIMNNSGGYGFNFYAGGIMSNCVIAGNSGLYGGLYMDASVGGSCEAYYCYISNNTATAGSTNAGGVTIRRTGIIRNSLICQNTNLSASGNGGGVFMNTTNASFTNGLISCTVAGNVAATEGGGVVMSGLSNYVVNCVIAGNSSSPGDYPNVYHKDNFGANSSNYFYTCAVTTDAFLLAEGQGNMTSDPKLIGGGNWRLRGASPCINAGVNQDWMTNAVDLDGGARILNVIVNMGAYERLLPPRGAIFKVF